MYRTEIWQPPGSPDQTQPSQQVLYVDNSVDNAEWIAIENRMSMPIGVGAINRNANNYLTLMHQVGGLSRACLPIDPDGDVELSIGFNPNTIINRDIAGTNQLSTILWTPYRSVSYTLMGNGNYFHGSLYPIDSCLPVTYRQIGLGASASKVFVADPLNTIYTNGSAIPVTQIINASPTTVKGYKEPVPQEVCIMYMQLGILNLTASASADMLIAQLLYGIGASNGDLSQATQFGSNISLFGAGPVGGTISADSGIVPCMGANGVMFTNTAPGNISYVVTFWLGIPTVPVQ